MSDQLEHSLIDLSEHELRSNSLLVEEKGMVIELEKLSKAHGDRNELMQKLEELCIRTEYTKGTAIELQKRLVTSSETLHPGQEELEQRTINSAIFLRRKLMRIIYIRKNSREEKIRSRDQRFREPQHATYGKDRAHFPAREEIRKNRSGALC